MPFPQCSPVVVIFLFVVQHSSQVFVFVFLDCVKVHPSVFTLKASNLFVVCLLFYVHEKVSLILTEICLLTHGLVGDRSLV